MVDSLMRHIGTFFPGAAPTAPTPQQTRDVLVYILKEYLQVPVDNPQIRSQLDGLEGLTESRPHQLGGSSEAGQLGGASDRRQLGYQEPKRLNEPKGPKKLNP